MRAATKDGDTAEPVKMVKEHLNICPLAQADNPPAEIFHNLSGKQFNTIHANNFEFYEELYTVIQKEPADAFPPELVGAFASIGYRVVWIVRVLISNPMMMAAIQSGSAPRHQRVKRATGFRHCRTKVTTYFYGCMAPWNRGSTRPGSREISSW